MWVFLDDGAGLGASWLSPDSGRSWIRANAGECLSRTGVATSHVVLWSTCFTGMMKGFERQVVGKPRTYVFNPDIGGTTSSTLMPLTDATALAVFTNGKRAELDLTHDGGQTTVTVAELPLSATSRNFLTAFVTEMLGYIVPLDGRRTIYRSVDGGHHWQPLQLDGVDY